MAITENRIPTSDLPNVGRGFLMGGADIVPGVSGGTVALILGIYERLVAAINHVDRTFLQQILKGQYRQAALHIDLRFLVALGAGIACGIISLASLMHYLLEHHRTFTLAAFFGMILASSLIVFRNIQVDSSSHRWRCVLIGVAGILLALWIVTRSPVATHNGYGYTFFSGMIGITAMILPGISGAYILLLLGQYAEITGIIKKLPQLQIETGELLTLLVFALGCGIGLLLFSKVLTRLLSRFHAETMSILCGFMLGSLYRIWPFQRDMTPEVQDLKYKQFELQMPTSFSSEVFVAIVVLTASLFAVLLLDYFGKVHREKVA